MGQKSKYIECTPRELSACKSAESFIVVINLGQGAQFRKRYNVSSFEDIREEIEMKCIGFQKAAIVYAIGVVDDIDVTALYATYKPEKNIWKTVDLEGLPDYQIKVIDGKVELVKTKQSRKNK